MRLCGTLAVALCVFAATPLLAQSGQPRGEPPTPLADAPSAPAVFPDATNTPLGLAIHGLLSPPAVARAHWGIAVTTLDGTPVYGLDQDKLFRPASTAKLFTTAAAMALLGPDHRFRTQIYGDLNAGTGAVKGDLVLVGGGDPGFGTADLLYGKGAGEIHRKSGSDLGELADRLEQAGVTTIGGDIVGDDTLFEAPTPPEGWAAEDLLWGYGALPSALSIGDDEVRVTVRPKPPGAVPGYAPNWIGSFATADQLFAYLTFDNAVLTMPADATHQDGIDAEALPGAPTSIRLYGRLSPGAPARSEEVALYDPAAYTAGALRALLLQRGTGITGIAKARSRPYPAEPASFLRTLHTQGCEGSLWGEPIGCAFSCLQTPRSTHLLAEHLSAPLAEDITYTLKTSANVHAEILLHQLGLLVSCPGVTTAEGARVLYRWLLHIGLPDGSLLLYDGSGLSTKDLVTPRAEAHLLAYAATQPWFPQWKAALPIGGVDGTLAGRFTDSPLKGRVFAKTGTLGETRALAGYIQCASGRELIFAILVDNHEPGASADRTAMDKIVEAIAASN